MERPGVVPQGALGRPPVECDAVGQAGRDAAQAQRPPTGWSGHRPRLRDRRYAAGSQSALARAAHSRWMGNAPGARGALFRDLDRKTRCARGHAANSPEMNQVADVNHVLVAIVWAVVGAGGGWLVRWGSVRLAKLEDLEPGSKPWQVWGPPIASALVFGIFGYELGASWLLLLHSVFGLVLVQVIFFDFEHRLILDRVIFPSMALALVVSLFNQPWWYGLATGVAAGFLFLLIALLGALIFKTEALGFGDVKVAAFMGLLLGPLPTIPALFYGVFLAGLAAIGVIIWNRSLKGTIAYCPYPAVGTLVALLQIH